MKTKHQTKKPHNRVRSGLSVNQLLRRNLHIEKLSRDDGIALPMVVLVLVLSMILIVAFMVSLVGSANVTKRTHSSIQAQAAAESGIAVIHQDLLSFMDLGEDVCAALPRTSTGDLIYTANVACTDEAEAEQLLSIRSEGTASDGTTQTIEATYELVRSFETPPFSLRSGKAVAYGDSASISATDLDRPADVYIEHGSFTCGGSGAIEGSVYVLDGNFLSGGNDCKIKGDVYASGDITLGGSSEATGSLTSLNGSVKLSGGLTIGGSVTAKQNFNASGSARVKGNVHVGGTVTLDQGPVEGWVKYAGSYSVTGPAPLGGATKTSAPTIIERTIQPWIELEKIDILAAGFKPEIWPASWCNLSSWGSPDGLAAIKNASSKTVFDATATCGAGGINIAWDQTLEFRTDVVFLAKKFTLPGLVQKSADGAEHKVWWVVPSSEPCTPEPKTNITINGGDAPGKLVTSLAYTPCNLNLTDAGATKWHGAIYTGSFSGSPRIDYSYILLPGMEDGGGGGTNETRLLTGIPVSQRNVN